MTIDGRLQALEPYVEDCQTLLENLSGTIDDLRYEETKGCIVRYAVDFSEIYNFVRPEIGAQEMKVFRDDGIEVGRAAQHVAGTTLFYGLPGRRRARSVILLAPYAVELEGFLEALPRGQSEHLAGVAARAVLEADGLRKDPAFARLQELANDLERDPRAQLPDRVQRELVEFVEKKGATLVRLLEDLNCDPRGRLIALAKDRRFEALRSCVEGGISYSDLDGRMIEWWDGQLRARRPDVAPNTNYLDAVAMATVKAAIERLEGSTIRLRLVTRSWHMKETLQAAVAEGQWPESGKGVIRHPVSFAAQSIAYGRSIRGTIRQLERMRESVAVFLESYREPPPVWAAGRTHRLDELNRCVHEIKDQWRTLAGLSASITSPTESAGAPQPQSPSWDIAGILRLLVDENALHQRIVKRVDEIAYALPRDFQYLGVYVRSQVTNLRGALRRTVDGERWETTSALSSNLYWMPYRLNFESTRLQEDATSISRRGRMSLGEVLDSLRDAYSARRDYERLLWMAYILGAQASWRLADRYCSLALLEYKSSVSFPDRSEALFFQAFCRRMRAKRFDHYRQALELLDEAMQQFATSHPEHQDARMLAERASIILEWNERFPSEPTAAGGQMQRPSITAVVDLSERALAVVDEEELTLRAQIHSILCYYYVMSSEEGSPEKARQQLNALVELQQRIAKDREAWGPCIADTIAFARWRLKDDSFTDDDRRKLIGELEALLRREEITPWRRDTIERHLDEIRGGGG